MKKPIKSVKTRKATLKRNTKRSERIKKTKKELWKRKEKHASDIKKQKELQFEQQLNASFDR